MKPIDGSLIFFCKNHNQKVLKLIFKVWILDDQIQNKWLQMYVQNMRKTNTEKNSKYLGFIVFGNLSFVTKINKIFLWRKNPFENWCQKYDMKQTQQPSCTNLNHISNFAKILIIWEHGSKSSSNSSATNAYASLYAQQTRYTIPNCDMNSYSHFLPLIIEFALTSQFCHQQKNLIMFESNKVSNGISWLHHLWNLFCNVFSHLHLISMNAHLQSAIHKIWICLTNRTSSSWSCPLGLNPKP
jgi:hypothetical protein